MEASVKSISAPVGGWNVKDDLADMPEHHASILDNFFPDDSVEVRPGYSSYATGMTGEVETLAEYISGPTRKLLAAANGNVWDISTTGAASSLASGFTVNRWQTANMDGKIGFVNGADAPQTYDGTTFGALTISGSGLTVANLIGVNIFQSRSYFWEDDSQNFWYSAVNTLGGTLTEFPLSRVGQFGGKLLAMGTWTRDAGDGMNDLAAFFMTSGEVIVYTGSDPASFSLVGVFRIGSPVSIRGIIKLAGDLVVITKDGYESLQAVIDKGRVGDKGILSDQINPAVIDATRDYGSNFGWQAFHYPKSNMLIFNVPVTTNQTYQQHVFNTNTGAPCRFRGINARCWGMFNDDAYFGGTGIVYKFDNTNDDDGAVIDSDCQTAVTYLNSKAIQKQVTAVQPVISSSGQVDLSVGVESDFKVPQVDYKAFTFQGGSSDWDTADWDTADWSTGGNVQRDWISVGRFGYNFSTRLKIRSKGQEIKWHTIRYMFPKGGLI